VVLLPVGKDAMNGPTLIEYLTVTYACVLMRLDRGARFIEYAKHSVMCAVEKPCVGDCICPVKALNHEERGRIPPSASRPACSFLSETD
jgi:hypothetical protein